MFKLDGEILRKICPSLTQDRAAYIAEAHKVVCPKYGIDTADILHEFLANELHESGDFTVLSESLNYQSIALQKLFSRERISMADCVNYGRTATHPANQEKLGNILYGGNWGRINLGNTQEGDGYLFRGCGPMQLTGRGNIAKFTKFYNNLNATSLTPEAMAGLLRTDLRIGIHSACWFFAVLKGLVNDAVNDNMKGIVKKINGGFIGYPERLKYYELAKEYIV